jgi:predicted phosphodiesterase
MRYLVLSDIHANLQALEAVLADAPRVGYDAVLVLGDLVGYGGDPAAVIERTLALGPAAIVRGNHDKVAAGLDDASTFSLTARLAIDWTASTLTAADRHRLASLPAGPAAVDGDVLICHGAPFDEDYYILSPGDGQRALRSTTARVCLFGHTHVTTLFGSNGLATMPVTENVVPLPMSGQLLANVGSVGQPRDGDPGAAYGILDTTNATLQFCRVGYDIAGAQARIREAGLPDVLADRLEYGR